MRLHIFQSRYLAAALCALGLGAGVVQGAEASIAAKEKAKKSVTSAADLKKLLDEAGKQRDALIADYETLRKELADATEEKKQAIRQKMEERKKAFEEMTIALHKQIRDEQRKQRAGAAAARR
jgi:phenylalanyl-tRNA synthetase alpha subunit